MTDDARGGLLVLGGSGFLGAHVVRAALRAGKSEPVWSASREPGAIAGSGARVRALDALRAGALEAACDELAPARVIVCTALTQIAECAAYPALARALNVDFPRRAARWCAEHGTRIVHVSTDLVFGADTPPPGGFDEEHAPAPLSEYGRSKAAGEEAVLASGADALVVRVPLLCGPADGRARGASESLARAIERGERPTLFEDEWRTPLDVRDAAAALVELAARAERGVLHVAGPDRLSRHDFGVLVLVARGLGEDEARSRLRASTRSEAGMEAERPRDVALDASRARALLATRLRPLREALAADVVP